MPETIPHRLASILDYKRDEVTALRTSHALNDLEALATAAPPPRPFEQAITTIARNDGNALICEVKRQSPSAGRISDAPAPEEIARRYETGGAACISVLTDAPSFGGSPDDLRAVRAAINLPVLRKDFMVDPIQIFESRAMGADAILVIMAAVSDQLAQELVEVATRLKMASLVESHTAEELERALSLPSPLIGVNNRNLHTFETDLAVTETLATQVPSNKVLISESGVRQPADITRLRKSSARGFLIGEAAMRSPDPASFVKGLAEAL